MTAVEAARQALHHLDTDTAPGTSPGDVAGSWAALKCVVALRDLLAEHDSGVWLDTRDVEALLWNGRGVFMDRDPDLGWTIWRHAAAMFGAPTRIGAGMTARDAVRAARGATGE